jgi:hypothetical protein
MAATGNWATEAERCADSRVGEIPVASWIILGRPAETYDTRMAFISKVLGVSSSDALIFRIMKLACWTSWMLTWSSYSTSESDEFPSVGERSSSEERYRSCSERGSLESSWVEVCTTAVSIRRVSAASWYMSGDVGEDSGRAAVGFSKAHCWSCVDTVTSAMVERSEE